MKFNREKFKTLVHYVCYRSPEPGRLGSTKLNKILWFADMFTYLETGKPLTGESYVKLKYGPVARHGSDALDDLAQEGDVVVLEPSAVRTPRQLIATRKPALDEFTADEIDLVNVIIDVICNQHTAQSISDLTHDALWEMAELGEVIPYEAFLAFQLKDEEVSESDLKWAKDEYASAVAG